MSTNFIMFIYKDGEVMLIEILKEKLDYSEKYSEPVVTLSAYNLRRSFI